MLFFGCTQSLQNEQRVIELPPNVSLSTASQFGQGLIAAGFFTDIQKRFPKLTQEQFQGVYLRWTTGSGGKPSVFLLTGIRCRRAFPEAKAVADYCESVVKTAVAANLSPP